MATNHFRIFHIESPGPLDALDGRAEAPALCAIAPLLRHKIFSQTTYSRDDFATLCKYLGTIGNYDDKAPTSPLVLHISAHGIDDGSGICFGADSVTWRELTELLQPFIQVRESYEGHHIVVLSACFAHKQTMTRIMGKFAGKMADNFVPPKYIFCTEEVLWKDATVAWTLFYHLVPKVDLDEPTAVKDLLTQINKILGVRLHYSRWDEKDSIYRHFGP